MEELLVDVSRAAPDVDQDEVGARRHVLHAERLELVIEEVASRLDHPHALEDVAVVLERGKRGRLRERVHVERLADPVHQRDRIRVRDAVADAQPGEARRLREGAEDGDLAPLLDVVERVREVRAQRELDVRLVEDDDGPLGDARHEAFDLIGRHDRRGGVVGVRDEDDLRHRGDRARHRLEIEAMLLQHHHDADAPGRLDDHRVHDEGRVRDDRLVAGPEERADEQLDQLVRAVAEHDLVGRRSVFLGERLPQIEAAAVRVPVEVVERGEDRPLHAVGRRQRVLVRRELDRVVDAQLALQLLDRLARLVRRDPEDVFVGQ